MVGHLSIFSRSDWMQEGVSTEWEGPIKKLTTKGKTFVCQKNIPFFVKWSYNLCSQLNRGIRGDLCMLSVHWGTGRLFAQLENWPYWDGCAWSVWNRKSGSNTGYFTKREECKENRIYHKYKRHISVIRNVEVTHYLTMNGTASSSFPAVPQAIFQIP